MKMRCPNCKTDTNYSSRGGWLNYSNGIGAPKENCPQCKKPMPTGRRFWNDLTFSEKLIVYSKAIIWMPVGMVFFTILGYLYTTSRDGRTGRRQIMTDEEAISFITENYEAVLLFAFVASLAANVTTIKMMIRSNTVRTRKWI